MSESNREAVFQDSESDLEYARTSRGKLWFSSAFLKRFVLVFLAVYMIGVSVLQFGCLRIDLYSEAEFQALLSSDASKMTIATISSVMQMLGGLAIPVSAFLAVEGMHHTSSVQNYLIRVSATALLAEILYDLAMHGTAWFVQDQNPVFGVMIAIFMLEALAVSDNRMKTAPDFVHGLVRLLIIAASVVWAILFQVNFGPITVMLAGLYEWFYRRNGFRILAGCILSIPYVSAPLAGMVLLRYNGKRGNIRQALFYYAAVPVLFTVCAVVRIMLVR